MKKVFYNYLNPAGSTYSTRIRTYKNLAEATPEEVVTWLENNCSHRDIMTLLAQYMIEEFNYTEEKTSKIRITQEQFDEFFRVIKPHTKKNEEEQ